MVCEHTVVCPALFAPSMVNRPPVPRGVTVSMIHEGLTHVLYNVTSPSVRQCVCLYDSPLSILFLCGLQVCCCLSTSHPNCWWQHNWTQIYPSTSLSSCLTLFFAGKQPDGAVENNQNKGINRMWFARVFLFLKQGDGATWHHTTMVWSLHASPDLLVFSCNSGFLSDTINIYRILRLIEDLNIFHRGKCAHECLFSYLRTATGLWPVQDVPRQRQLGLAAAHPQARLEAAQKMNECMDDAVGRIIMRFQLPTWDWC